MAKTENEIPLNSSLKDKMEGMLLDMRRLFLCNAIDNDTVEDMIRKLWYLESKAPGKPILLIINSPGGSVDGGFAIWDQIKMITSPVTTLVTGLAASMGSVLSLAAAPKRRFATPQARIMVHQPRLSGIIQGQATDLEIHAREILKTHAQLVELYVNATGRTYAEIEKAIDRDTWMTTEEALNFGLLDKIITSFKEIE